MKISICIPTYEMHGKGLQYLSDLFFTIDKQTYKNFEVIISDHSIDNNIKNFIINYNNFEIKYHKNDKNRGSSSSNINNAIKNASGDIIKPIFQDDLLINEDVLTHVIQNFENWGCLASYDMCEKLEYVIDRRIPKYNEKMLEGVNTISSPSVIFFKNDNNYFDENLIWLMDTEFYYRLYKKYGLPNVVSEYSIINRVWGGQITKSIINNDIIFKEHNYVKEKYNV